jgi:hypothetical protein
MLHDPTPKNTGHWLGAPPCDPLKNLCEIALYGDSYCLSPACTGHFDKTKNMQRLDSSITGGSPCKIALLFYTYKFSQQSIIVCALCACARGQNHLAAVFF